MQKILEKYHMEKLFQRENLVLLVLLGILVVVITIPVKEQEDDENIVRQEENAVVGASEGVIDKEYEKWYSYATYLEEELEDILSKVKGVGEVSVMITLETSEELITEKDEIIVLDETKEQDSQGGNRTVFQSDRKEETIYQKEDGVESPYIKKTKLPQISGVLIVAQGAGNGTVKKRIVEIAEALFDVQVHKITVVEMN